MQQDDTGKMLNVIAKSWTDPDYKQKLMADPKGVLTSEGIDVPPSANVHVIDQQPNDMHVILPPKPAGDIQVISGPDSSATPYMTFAKTTAMTLASTAPMTLANTFYMTFHGAAKTTDPSSK